MPSPPFKSGSGTHNIRAIAASNGDPNDVGPSGLANNKANMAELPQEKTMPKKATVLSRSKLPVNSPEAEMGNERFKGERVEMGVSELFSYFSSLI